MADEAGTLTLGNVHVDAGAVNVVHEQFSSIPFRPTVAQINHHARVRVPAPCRRRASIGRVRTFGACVMNVVTDRLDVVINERVDIPLIGVGMICLVRAGFLNVDVVVQSALPFVAGALNDVPEVRNHARLDEALAVFVEVNAPGIARAFREHFEDAPRGVKTPDRGIDALPLLLRRARLGDKRRTEHAVAAVEPAVRSPGKRVQRFVRVAGVIPAIQ